MALTTLDDYLNAVKNKIRYTKASATTVGGFWSQNFHLAGIPTAGSLGWIALQGNASLNGVVIDCSRAGFPLLYNVPETSCYLTGFNFSDSVLAKLMIYDRIWEAGPFDVSINKNIEKNVLSLTPNPSFYEYRVPLKPDGTRAWNQIELWVDISVATTNQAGTLIVGYINENGTQSYTVDTSAIVNMAVGRTTPLSLAPGDRGVQKVTDVSISGNIMSTGIFNLVLARVLHTNARIGVTGNRDIHGFDKIGFPVIDPSAALAVCVSADSTNMGVTDCIIEITNA